MQNAKLYLHAMTLTSAISLAGCANTIRPDALKKPPQLSCLQVPQGIEAHEIKGLADFHWTTKLASGPYLSEGEDAEGTFYRAPSGGIYIGRDDLADKPASTYAPRIYDGGVWLPKKRGLQPYFYIYPSLNVPKVESLPDYANCANAIAIPAPEGKNVSAIAFATGGAIGGAAGGVIARGAVGTSSISYGKAAGLGAVGGALGGLLIASIINMDEGKISPQPLPKDPRFGLALEGLADKVVLVPMTQVTSKEDLNKELQP